MTKSALVCGAGGFIGSHLVRRLRRDGYFVRGVDIKLPEYSESDANEFVVSDLRDLTACQAVFDRRFDEVYQLAADMGGAGFVFTGQNDADILCNSARINLNVIQTCRQGDIGRIFFSSSACVYPRGNQVDADHPVTREDSVYPADPDSDYGFEKLFAERLYLAAARNNGIVVRIARYHNVFGPECAWRGGREKAPAALCRKVAEAGDRGKIEIWGDGRQTRSFLYIDECIEGTLRIMHSGVVCPVNIGSEEMITINTLAEAIAAIAGKRIRLVHVPGPQGVRGRRSDNEFAREHLEWAPSMPLASGLEATYRWIAAQLSAAARRTSSG
jgi:nucleoside-diphosphate-sugar epimerase